MTRKKGFTLIELLVVVSIIALLVSILLPSLSKARAQAKAVVCQSNLAQWRLMLSMYTDDSDGRFWGGWNSGSQDQCWLVAMQEYYEGAPDILLCPSAVNPWVSGSATFKSWGVWSGHFPSPPVPDRFIKMVEDNDLRGSYGINWFVSNPSARVTPYLPPGTSRGDFWRRTTTVENPSNVPVLLDCVFWLGRPNHTDEPPAYDGEAQFYSGGEMRRFCINRHSGHINGLFMDLSVRKIGLKDLWTLKWHRSFDTHAGPKVWPEWMNNL